MCKKTSEEIYKKTTYHFRIYIIQDKSGVIDIKENKIVTIGN